MATMIARMLDQAEDIVERYPGSKAAKRRAVSAAYYAVFLKLMETCAGALLPAAEPGSDQYERVYRALDHKPMKNGFRSSVTLRSRPALQEIGELVVGLQAARMMADYASPGRKVVDLAGTHQHLASARLAIEILNSLDERDRQTLAVHLLFRERSTD